MIQRVRVLSHPSICAGGRPRVSCESDRRNTPRQISEALVWSLVLLRRDNRDAFCGLRSSGLVYVSPLHCRIVKTQVRTSLRCCLTRFSTPSHLPLPVELRRWFVREMRSQAGRHSRGCHFSVQQPQPRISRLAHSMLFVVVMVDKQQKAIVSFWRHIFRQTVLPARLNGHFSTSVLPLTRAKSDRVNQDSMVPCRSIGRHRQRSPRSLSAARRRPHD
jgi:hypothetical protein